MGWVRKMPSDYNGEIERIDEQIFKLIHERKQKTGGKRFVPPKELQEKWVNDFEMKKSEVNLFLHSLNHGTSHARQDFSDKGKLQGVLPIMKKGRTKGYECTITHAKQYENASEVSVEFAYMKEDETAPDHLQIHLLLEVHGEKEYVSRHHGGGGSGDMMSSRFLISPRLPEDLDSVSFMLEPHMMPFVREHKIFVLDEPVQFD